MTIDILLSALEKSWIRETAYKTDQKNWSVDKKETGQCTVTAILVYDYFGGQIIRGFSKKYNLYHYWNVINGQKYDLTFNQFYGEKDDISFVNLVRKEKKDLLKINNVRQRYELLKQRVEYYLNKT